MGGGRIGRQYLDIIKKDNLNLFFYDKRKDLQRKRIKDVYCLDERELKEYRERALVVICVAFEYINEIVEFMNKEKYNYISCYEFLFYNRYKNFFNAYRLLTDSKSKFVFNEQLNARFSFDEKRYKLIFEEDQYFCLSDFRNINKNMCFIDVGAFVGDTLEYFLNIHSGIFDSYYSFEPDFENYNALVKRTQRLEQEWNIKNKIFNINMGVGDRNGCVGIVHTAASNNMNFYLNQESNDDLSENVNKISITTLDSYFQNINLDGKKIILKADIEGNELSLLKGAKQFIQKYKPLIAICIYHNPDDFYEIPLFLNSLNKNYKYSIRHHSYMDYETVLYCY